VNTVVSRIGRFLQVGGVGMVASATLIVGVGASPPAGAVTGPAATVTPHTNLTDGQSVAISASGFPADRTLQVEECAGTTANPPTDNTACDGITLDSSTGTDSQGNYDNPAYTVYLRPNSLPSPATISCDASHACVLFIGVDQNNLSQPHAFADLSFSAATTTTSATTTTTSSPTTSSTTMSSTTTSSTTRSSTTTSTEKPRHPTTSSTATTIPVTATTVPAAATTSTSTSTTSSSTTTTVPANTTTSTPTQTTAVANPGAVASGGGSGGG